MHMANDHDLRGSRTRRQFYSPRLAAYCGVLLACAAQTAVAQPLQLKQTEATIAVSQGDQPILVYNKRSPPVPEGMDPIYRRSAFLHPVNTPQGLTVTETFPADHPHQHGIFTAWVKASFDGREVDFWNLAGGTGRVLHDRVISTFASMDAAGFEVDLIHRLESTPTVDVLRERWKVTVYPTDGSYRCFDLETRQKAVTDTPLLVHEYHYGGLALRGPTRWLLPSDRAARGELVQDLEASSFVNNHGSDRISGNHERARWVAMTGTVEGRPATISVLCHRNNFRAPQPARLHPTKPYFCFAPCVDGPFEIDRDHPYRARYRYLVTDAPPDAEWLDKAWDKWCGQ